MEAIRKHLPESWSLVLSAFAAAYGIGLLALLALPYMISAVISDLGLDEAQAGYLLSAEFMCMMLASLLVAPLMGRVPRKTVALFGAAIAVIGNLMSAHITDITSLTLMRCLVGAGCGLAFACGNATVVQCAGSGQCRRLHEPVFRGHDDGCHGDLCQCHG